MEKLNRRKFLKTTAVATAATIASPLLANQKSRLGEDYKALVCVHLEGGADTFNMVVPKENVVAYNDYKDARAHMAIEREKLRELVKNEHGFHPNMPKMQMMHNYGDLAVIANVGTLNRRVTHKDIAESKKGVGIKTLPHRLFCHDTQKGLWEKELNKISKEFKSIKIDSKKSFEEQLEEVARLIKHRKTDMNNRQVFFVTFNGWDTHDKAICDSKASESGGDMIARLDKAFALFSRELDELGLKDKVTTFTTSEFGRTITSNNNGADHGWGGHAFVFGGAVNGGFYGKMPEVKRDSPDALINNVVVPTTSVEQYMATLVEWLGDKKVNLSKLFPNLENFDKKSLGFMA